MTEPKLKTVALRPRTAAALAWALQEAVDVSMERVPGLSLEDATQEIADLADLRDLLAGIGGAPKDLVAIDADLARLRKELDGRDPRGAIEAQAIADYDAVAGQIVLCTQVECYDAGTSVTAHCEPPAVLRIYRYGSEKETRDGVLHWTDDKHLDPHYNVEVLAPHPAFAGLSPSWVFGTCRTTDGHVEPAPFALADEAARIAYAGAKGLSDDEVAPAAGPTP
jgi:hypothetical protein